MLVSRVASAGSAGLASENVQLQAPPSQLQLPKATVSFAIAETVEAAEGSGAFIKVTVTTDKLVPWGPHCGLSIKLDIASIEDYFNAWVEPKRLPQLPKRNA